MLDQSVKGDSQVQDLARVGTLQLESQSQIQDAQATKKLSPKNKSWLMKIYYVECTSGKSTDLKKFTERHVDSKPFRRWALVNVRVPSIRRTNVLYGTY